MTENKTEGTQEYLTYLLYAVLIGAILYLLFSPKKSGKKQEQTSSGYIGSPSGIEYSGCLSEYSLNYPYKYGYGGYGNLGSGMTMPSWADTYNQEIGGCVSVWENGRNVIKCMR